MKRDLDINDENKLHEKTINYGEGVRIRFRIHDAAEANSQFPGHLIIGDLFVGESEEPLYNELTQTNNMDWIPRKVKEIGEQLIGRYHIDGEDSKPDPGTPAGEFAEAVEDFENEINE